MLRDWGMAAWSVFLTTAVLMGGLLPLSMPLGIATGGIIDTGQLEPQRWWLAAAAAICVYTALSWRMGGSRWLYWLSVLLLGLAGTILIFCCQASSGQNRSGYIGGIARQKVGVVSALPIFWSENKTIAGHLQAGPDGSGMPLPAASRHEWKPVDHVDAQALQSLSALLLAQPRLLQPDELVALDTWVRAGGKAVVLADPMLVWPTALPLGDARRAPATSLLDPLLTHWGLRLEPVRVGQESVSRRMLKSGHVLMTAAASRFSLLPATAEAVKCMLSEGGFVATCQVGSGHVQLVADADMIDDRLWLADARWPGRSEAMASDVVMLVDGWLADPSGQTLLVPPRRVVSDAALVTAMRHAILAAILWAGLGAFGYRLIFQSRRGEKC
jgi:hypothetical protein